MDLFELVTQAQMNLALVFTIKTSETEPAVFYIMTEMILKYTFFLLQSYFFPQTFAQIESNSLYKTFWVNLHVLKLFHIQYYNL